MTKDGEFGQEGDLERQSLAPINGHSLTVANLKFLLIGLIGASLWSIAGIVIAYIQGNSVHFIAEWQRVAAFPCLALATWLMLLARSGMFERRIARLLLHESQELQAFASRWLQLIVGVTVCVLACLTSIGMGFNASGPSLYFFWATAGISGVLAGVVMVHTIEMIIVIHKLQSAKIKTFRYSPARTPQLRDIVSYFATFALILSVAYFFAFVGTNRGHWTGNPGFIEAVQLFWPMIYVPVCSVALLYPHVVVHWIIQQEKERTLQSCQREIDNLLGDYGTLENEDVQRVNSLAQFFDRLAGTPDYVVDFGISVRTFTPIALNLMMLFAKHAIGLA